MSSGTGTATGAGLLLRHNLRRDRVIVAIVLVLMAVMTYASAASTTTLYQDVADRVSAARAINAQPALRALYGRIMDVHALGEVAMTKMTVTYAAFACALFIALIRRHTRMEEETGRAELVGATAVGRDAAMVAAVVESSAVAVVLATLVASMCLLGGLPVAGSLWFGVIWLGTGLVATGVGAVACQCSASARSCAGIAAGIMGVLFAIRAAGDASSDVQWLSWLSPLGWNTQLRAWSQPRPWVAPLYLATSVALLLAAQAMRGRRDLGSGLIAARPGRVDGRRWFASPYALVVRGQLVALTLWSAGCLAMGVLFGLIAPGLQDLLDSVDVQQVLDHLGGALIAAVLSVAGIVVTCFGIMVITHVADDETSGRVELALSTGASRGAWWRAVALAALGGVAWLLVLTGAGLWAGLRLGGFDHDGGRSWTALVAALAWIPAAWVVVGVALLCHGWGAHRAALGWAGLGVCVFLTVAGDLIHLPGWIIRLSPYSSVPAYPADPWRWLPFVLLTLVAVLLAVGAWLRFERRDIG
ncbi:ABC transporter permease [Nocardioides nematodiphilus]|uniref:ABC transporter permease n=1 Tax=Nocardioides nematodiphilus TaxID=2849669 RepID=UPI001CD95D28|nr:hypothetical protein [Nocardioides nematodiphilus]MCA1981929.1 hypothetical protein [Nocardioides nematodiphilus]